MSSDGSAGPPVSGAGGGINTGPVPDRGAPLIALLWILTAASFGPLVGRVYVRTRARKCGWEDLFMLLTILCFIGWSTVLTLYSLRGGERHIGDLMATGPDNVANVLFLNWLSQIFGIMGVALGKVSVAALLLAIIRQTDLRWQRVFLWTFTIALAMLIAIATSILTFSQCTPAAALWDMRIEGKCINPHIMSSVGTFTGSYNTFADASLAIIPATIFWQLRLSILERIQLSIVFGLNILTSICSGIKTQYLVELSNRTDPTWATLPIFIWVTIELFLIVVCGTLPTLQPVMTLCRTLVSSIASRVSELGSSRRSSRRAPGTSRLKSEPDFDMSNELSGVGHTKIASRTVIEPGELFTRDSSNDLERDRERLGVRVDLVYDVRHPRRPASSGSLER